jgi:hypothetical protein
MIVSKANLVSSFSTGRFPTGQDFENLIDSTYNDWLTANNATLDTLNVKSIVVNSNPGLSTTIHVSLFPSGSAILTFDGGSLVGVVSGL